MEYLLEAVDCRPRHLEFMGSALTLAGWIALVLCAWIGVAALALVALSLTIALIDRWTRTHDLISVVVKLALERQKKRGKTRGPS